MRHAVSRLWESFPRQVLVQMTFLATINETEFGEGNDEIQFEFDEEAIDEI
jgi:hypothetical protein